MVLDWKITEEKLKEIAERYGLDIELYSKNPGFFVEGRKVEIEEVFEDFFDKELVKVGNSEYSDEKNVDEHIKRVRSGSDNQ